MDPNMFDDLFKLVKWGFITMLLIILGLIGIIIWRW